MKKYFALTRLCSLFCIFIPLFKVRASQPGVKAKLLYYPRKAVVSLKSENSIIGLNYLNSRWPIASMKPFLKDFNIKDRHKKDILHNAGLDRVYEVEFYPSGTDFEVILSALKSENYFDFVEPYYARHKEEVNDPRFNEQWALNNTG